jgi:hypothetical protein
VKWLPSRLRGAADIPTWTALAFAIVLVVQPAKTGAVVLSALTILIVTILAARSYRLGWIAILVLVGIGVGLRLGVWDHRASDVLDVTGAALRRAFQGESPWGHGFLVSRPSGAPFPYGPLGLFWYTPALESPRQLELFVSCGVLALLAVHGRPLGLAVYATAPTLVLTATDGSNDTSAGLLILIALGLAAKRPWLGAAVLAAAVAFKPYAAAWVPPLLFYGGLPALASFAAASVAVWAPSALTWGLGDYLKSLQMAEATHHTTYWSFGVFYEEIVGKSAPRESLDRFRLAVGGVLAVAGLYLARSIDGVIVAGILVFIAVMFGGYWGSYAYLGALAPIVCWRLDDWLRIPAPAMIANAPWAPRTAG